MTHYNTIFSQLLKLMPRTMAMAQLTSRNSLRDIVKDVTAQSQSLSPKQAKLARSNQGVLLMIPNMHKIATELCPSVFQVAA